MYTPNNNNNDNDNNQDYIPLQPSTPRAPVRPRFRRYYHALPMITLEPISESAEAKSERLEREIGLLKNKHREDKDQLECALDIYRDDVIDLKYQVAQLTKILDMIRSAATIVEPANHHKRRKP